MHFNTSQNLIRASIGQQQYTRYALVFFAIILLLAISLIIVSDYRRFEKQFASNVELVNTRFNFYMKQNEAILEGLSAFVAGTGKVEKPLLDSYSEKVIRRFPHVYMLEVAERVENKQLSSFIQQQRIKTSPDFDIRAFDYEKKHQWMKIRKADFYYPIVFLYPERKGTDKVLGLDLMSHRHLLEPVQHAISTGNYETTLPFTLIEGKKAFIMLKAVDSYINNGSNKYIAMVVITADKFDFNDIIDEATSLVICHNSLPEKDKRAVFLQKSGYQTLWLPQLDFKTTAAAGEHGLVLKISKQFRFSDISWILLLVVTHVLISLFFIIRQMMLKNQQSQEELLKASQQQHKMIAVSNLTGGLAHEFNNNLSVVRGFLNLLQERCKDDNEANSWIQHAEKATEKSIHLTHKLLTYSRYKGIRERAGVIDANECINELQNEIKAQTRKGILLKYVPGENIPAIFISREDFREILLELVLNATEAIEGNGAITISTERIFLQSGKDIDIDYNLKLEPGEYLHLAVADSGCGISEDIRLHVYDPFFTTREFAEKSGMGLASVYGLVKLNNGFIHFESEQGRGTVFHVYLPVIGQDKVTE